jgi:hypothetical protein
MNKMNAFAEISDVALRSHIRECTIRKLDLSRR